MWGVPLVLGAILLLGTVQAETDPFALLFEALDYYGLEAGSAQCTAPGCASTAGCPAGDPLIPICSLVKRDCRLVGTGFHRELVCGITLRCKKPGRVAAVGGTTASRCPRGPGGGAEGADWGSAAQGDLLSGYGLDSGGGNGRDRGGVPDAGSTGTASSCDRARAAAHSEVHGSMAESHWGSSVGTGGDARSADIGGTVPAGGQAGAANGSGAAAGAYFGSCRVAVLQALPAGVFADPWELARWKRDRGRNPKRVGAFRVFGPVDVESVETLAEPTLVAAETLLTRKAPRGPAAGKAPFAREEGPACHRCAPCPAAEAAKGRSDGGVPPEGGPSNPCGSPEGAEPVPHTGGLGARASSPSGGPPEGAAHVPHHHGHEDGAACVPLSQGHEEGALCPAWVLLEGAVRVPLHQRYPRPTTGHPVDTRSGLLGFLASARIEFRLPPPHVLLGCRAEAMPSLLPNHQRFCHTNATQTAVNAGTEADRTPTVGDHKSSLLGDPGSRRAAEGAVDGQHRPGPGGVMWAHVAPCGRMCNGEGAAEACQAGAPLTGDDPGGPLWEAAAGKTEHGAFVGPITLLFVVGCLLLVLRTAHVTASATVWDCDCD
eukprot:jgi/Botrbrau1/21343/Bobra.0184s0053.1